MEYGDATKYGFTIIHQDDRFDYDEMDYTPADLWHVQLPHQCDAWKIAGEKYGDGVSHDDAVAALEAFIVEAQVALRRLRDKESDEEY